VRHPSILAEAGATRPPGGSAAGLPERCSDVEASIAEDLARPVPVEVP
jgi:hypothetical protein